MSFYLNGNFIYAEEVDNSEGSKPLGIDVDLNGNIILVGSFIGSLNIDGHVANSIPDHLSSFILKYNSTFICSWLKMGVSNGGGLYSGWGRTKYS